MMKRVDPDWRNKTFDHDLCCVTCRYAAEEPVEGYFALCCHRRSPTDQQWPIVYNSNWCGEYGEMGSDPVEEPGATHDPYVDWKAKNLQFPLDIPNQYGNQLAVWEANLPDGWDEKDAFYLSNDKVPYEFSTFGMKVYDKMTYLGFRKKPSGQYVNGGTVVLLFDENGKVAAIPHEYMKLVEVVG